MRSRAGPPPRGEERRPRPNTPCMAGSRKAKPEGRKTGSRPTRRWLRTCSVSTGGVFSFLSVLTPRPSKTTRPSDTSPAATPATTSPERSHGSAPRASYPTAPPSAEDIRLDRDRQEPVGGRGSDPGAAQAASPVRRRGRGTVPLIRSRVRRCLSTALPLAAHARREHARLRVRWFPRRYRRRSTMGRSAPKAPRRRRGPHTRPLLRPKPRCPRLMDSSTASACMIASPTTPGPARCLSPLSRHGWADTMSVTA